jgi:hypothetical protein
MSGTEQESSTAAYRLAILLPWLNGVESMEAAWGPTHPLNQFVNASRRESTVLSWSGGEPSKLALEAIRHELIEILEEAEGKVHKRHWNGHFVTLQLIADRVRKRPKRLPPKGSPERQALEGPGAFQLQIGVQSLRDLVVYLLKVHTLAESGAVYLARCEAPAAGDWSRSCGKWIASGGRRGPRRKYCPGDACRVRAQRRERHRRDGRQGLGATARERARKDKD